MTISGLTCSVQDFHFRPNVRCSTLFWCKLDWANVSHHYNIYGCRRDHSYPPTANGAYSRTGAACSRSGHLNLSFALNGSIPGN
ncbi:hypothetical protein CRG98_003848 [Punica granatum]|uniref:S-protein homolog n=1 Tax=Punica granatum TaxID=22663 RepID=A0A2I0L525_PUNGR|nr:hypothetical protein CRG98_003848 [Punica granatum]